MRPAAILMAAIAFVGPLHLQAAPPRSLSSAMTLVLPDLRLDGVPLTSAIDYFQEASGANFHVNWKALEALGVARDTPVTVHAKGLTLQKALTMTLSQLPSGDQISFYREENVIEITSRELANNAVVTVVYDVSDLLIALPQIGQAGQGGAGGTTSRGGGGSNAVSRGRDGGHDGTVSRNTNSAVGSRTVGTANTGASNAGASGDTAAMMDDLANLIQDLVEPTVWAKGGGTATIRPWRQCLIVTAPRRIHDLILSPK
jgi:hypothetical protein